jgi:ribosomal protein S5
VSKVLGSKNKINNAKATFMALRALRLPENVPSENKTGAVSMA